MTVQVTGAALQGDQTETTDQAGRYLITQLPPGDGYVVRFYFNDVVVERPGIRLTVPGSQERITLPFEVCVHDTGPGIPQAERDHVLRRFVRLEASRNEPGSGLGLSLVAAVARLHDARIDLSDANPGLVATLRFHLKD